MGSLQPVRLVEADDSVICAEDACCDPPHVYPIQAVIAVDRRGEYTAATDRLCASAGIHMHLPMPAHAAGHAPPGSWFIRVYFAHGFTKYISNDLCERLRRGTYKDRQFLNSSSWRHIDLSSERVQHVILANRCRFTRIMTELERKPIRIM